MVSAGSGQQTAKVSKHRLTPCIFYLSHQTEFEVSGLPVRSLDFEVAFAQNVEFCFIAYCR